MSSQKIRSILAVATLTAGVTWLAVGPSAADSCKAERAQLSSQAIASYCGEHAVNDDALGGGGTVTDESDKLAMAAGRMATQLGLTGLATAREVLGAADMGGVAATWGMPSPALFPKVPGSVGMQDLSTMAGIPALPALPEVPPRPLGVKLPELSLGHTPYRNRFAGSGIESATTLKRPVEEVGAEVVDVLLPKTVESIEDTSLLTGGQTTMAGFSGLVPELALR
ncbi:hypothetical protein [Nonomuraea sp. NPDC049784]|uniref:hypothetical protein n=1 Tax=Nonomuraea sp. NPDC049784 TaxID=3154361 RepID=UPI0034086545